MVNQLYCISVKITKWQSFSGRSDMVLQKSTKSTSRNCLCNKAIGPETWEAMGHPECARSELSSSKIYVIQWIWRLFHWCWRRSENTFEKSIQRSDKVGSSFSSIGTQLVWTSCPWGMQRKLAVVFKPLTEGGRMAIKTLPMQQVGLQSIRLRRPPERGGVEGKGKSPKTMCVYVTESGSFPCVWWYTKSGGVGGGCTVGRDVLSLSLYYCWWVVTIKSWF